MLKHVLAIIILSIVIILAMPYAQSALHYLVSAHDWLSDLLKEVFSGGQAGNIIRELLALLAIPVAVSLVPIIIYWIAKRSWFPYWMEVIWVVWLIQTSALIVLYKVSS
jgi:hypothetical protein